MTNVLLADDHPLFRQALQAVITRAQPQLKIIEVENLAGAQAILANGPVISLVLLDLKMPDCGGFAGLLSLRAQHPQLPIVVVSGSDDAGTISKAITFGAAGFIPKSATHVEISQALQAVLAGDVWVPRPVRPNAAPKIADSIASFSAPQLKILLGLQRGLLNKQIASEIGITEATVKSHMTIMFRKMGVSNRTQAVIAAQTLTLDEPDR